MDIIADILLASGAIGAAIYCQILAGRLKRFNALESGMGGAIAVLSAQVDDMTRALDTAGRAAHGSVDGLNALVERAEAASTRLELILAALHDVDDDSNRRARFIRRRPVRGVEAAE